MTRTADQQEQAQRLVRLVETIRIHLGVHDVAVPVILTVNPGMSTDVTGQLSATDLPHTATALLGWADTLTGVTAEIWRPHTSDSTHLVILGATSSGVRVRIYGVVAADTMPTILQPGDHRAVLVTDLADWAGSTRTSSDGGVAA
jgi:hypothetical protein